MAAFTLTKRRWTWSCGDESVVTALPADGEVRKILRLGPGYVLYKFLGYNCLHINTYRKLSLILVL